MGPDTYGTEGYLTGETSGSEWEEEGGDEERECGPKFDSPVDSDAINDVDKLLLDKQSQFLTKKRRLHNGRGKSDSGDASAKSYRKDGTVARIRLAAALQMALRSSRVEGEGSAIISVPMSKDAFQQALLSKRRLEPEGLEDQTLDSSTCTKNGPSPVKKEKRQNKRLVATFKSTDELQAVLGPLDTLNKTSGFLTSAGQQFVSVSVCMPLRFEWKNTNLLHKRPAVDKENRVLNRGTDPKNSFKFYEEENETFKGGGCAKARVMWIAKTLKGSNKPEEACGAKNDHLRRKSQLSRGGGQHHLQHVDNSISINKSGRRVSEEVANAARIYRKQAEERRKKMRSGGWSRPFASPA